MSVVTALARSGVMTKLEAESAVRGGRITVAGQPVRSAVTLVRPEDDVRLDGRRVALDAETIVLAFHKPAATISSRRDPDGRRTVFDVLLPLLPKDLSSYEWHAVGRLDRDTTGLLLFTNDARFVAHATQPDTQLPKRYVADVQGSAEDRELAPLRAGIELLGGRVRPAKIVRRGPGVVEITITEGRYHQVKRMLGAVKLPVRKLHREAIGSLTLDLPEGAWRRLSNDEIQSLGFAPTTRQRR